MSLARAVPGLCPEGGVQPARRPSFAFGEGKFGTLKLPLLAVVVPISASTEPQAAPTQKLHRWRTVSGPHGHRHAVAVDTGTPRRRYGAANCIGAAILGSRIGRPQTRGLVDERARGLPPDKSPELLKQASSGTRPPIFVPPPLLWAEGWGGAQCDFAVRWV